jgi:hypothetical protein
MKLVSARARDPGVLFVCEVCLAKGRSHLVMAEQSTTVRSGITPGDGRQDFTN